MQHQSRIVLVVEDDVAVRKALQFSLELEGFSVRAYEDEDSLLRDSQSLNSDCLIIDYYLGQTNGIDVVNRLRRHNVSLPAILITTQATDRLRRQAELAGFEAILEKPLDDSSLLDTIQKIVRKS